VTEGTWLLVSQSLKSGEENNKICKVSGPPTASQKGKEMFESLREANTIISRKTD
jgi:hypothetical protein